MEPIVDSLGAFCPGPRPFLAGKPGGPLAGLTFAAKDLFDVAGFVTGAGNPDWAATHPPAERTAGAVLRLVEAGASLVAKTLTDEIAFSINGENAHYGTPRNPAAPGRVPGGSSSGSASAVAGGLVDTALGTDTGGSVRIPASYCGLYGIRPSHGAIPADGLVPLAPRFDTIGWFARSAGTLAAVGDALLPRQAAEPVRRLLVARDAFDLAGTDVTRALAPPLDRLRRLVMASGEVTVAPTGIAVWLETFRTLQGYDIWRTHGAWIEAARPRFGPGIRERFAWSATVGAAENEAAERTAAGLRAEIDALLEPGTVLCLPTTPGIAPLRGTPAAELDAFRARALSLTAIAGIGGLPQLTLPLATLEGCPLGLSLIGARGADRALVAFAERAEAEAG